MVIEASESIADGNYDIKASVTDSAGNTNSDFDYGLVVDTTPADFNVYPSYLLGLGLVINGYYGTAEAAEGTRVYIVDELLLGIDLGLTSNVYAEVDSSGNWTSFNLDLDLLGLLGTGLENTYFYIIDNAGNFTIKDGANTLRATGNIHDESQSVIYEDGSSMSAVGDTVSAERLEPDVESLIGQSTPVVSESIDLSRVLGGEQTHSNEVEPLNLTLNEVISDGDDVLALDSASESSSIAFNGDTAKTAEPATDVQNQSEEMIKKLIESGNNQIDM